MEEEKEREWYWHHPTDEDMKAAEAAVASLLRYLLPPPRGVPASYKRGSQKPDCFANYALPGVAKWPPRLGDAELIAALEVMVPERKRVLRLVAGLDQWAVAYMIRLLAAGREREPRRLWEYYRCLVAAFTLGGGEGVDRELRPCLACPRFFVARSAKRLTCSDACRQRYSRYSREDWKAALERDRRRKVTSAKCSLSPEPCTSAKHPPDPN